VSESSRTDKWLWAARFFKTRGLAAELCANGKVRRLAHPLKAASAIHPGDLLEIPFVDGPGVRTVLVKSVIQSRVGAPEARGCYDELTAPEVFEAQRQWHLARSEGMKGRPTKKDRREMERIRGFLD
jgi:ribosome-associated heat shock protein Hsp15